MSLQKIGKYTEIFESSRKLQRPTAMDVRRITEIQNIAIAGLIESGAPYEIENGQIIIDTGVDYKSVMLSDIYNYLSTEGQTSVIIKNLHKAELPPPGYYQQSYQQEYEFQPYQNIPSQNQPYQSVNNIQPQQTPPPVQEAPVEEVTESYQTQASMNAEKKADPIKAMMDGLEDYSNEQNNIEEIQTTPEDEELEALFDQNLRQKKAEQEKWQNAAEIRPQPADNSPYEALRYETPAAPTTLYNPANETPQTVESPTSILSAEQSEIADQDVVEMNKKSLTYERCNIEIKNPQSGSVYRFAVHSAPLTSFNDKHIIVRVKLLGKDNSYIQTNHGSMVDFTIENALFTVVRDETEPGIFSCKFTITKGYEISKINIERGGNGGNLVIYDENLELRIYPLPNIKDKITGKMVFGNNKKDEAAYLYYIKTGNTIIASSGVERKPTFSYNDCMLIIKAKWFGNDIRLSAEEYVGGKL